MPVTRLSDAFIYDVYMSYTSVDSPEKTELVASGAVANSPVLDQIAAAAGKMVEVPYWNDLDADLEPDYTNDDPADLALPDKIDSGNMRARKSFQHKSWSTMHLLAELSRANPLEHIRNRFGAYWAKRFQRRCIAIMEGVIADNIANDDGDMGMDISGTAGDGGRFGSRAFVGAAYTMGDAVGGLTVMGVHSRIMARLVENDEIVYLPDSTGALTIPSYKGSRVFMDDSMPTEGTGENMVFTSMLFGSGVMGFGGAEGQVLGFGEGVPVEPAYIDTKQDAGNGGGQDIIGERNTWLIHPHGFSFTATDAQLAEFSPTLAELRVGTYWDRELERKLVPFAWIKSRA